MSSPPEQSLPNASAKSTNVTNFLQSSSSAFLSVIVSSHVVKGTVLLLVISYFLTFSSSALDHLSVVPGYVLPPNFWIWTLITHNFLQVHMVMVLIDICVVILSGKLLEPLWGPLQIGIFFLIVCCCSAVCTALTYMVFYYVTGNTNYLFETRIHGLGAYIGGFSVVVKQLMPDEVLLRLPFGKVRNRHIPLLCLVTAIVLSLCGVLNGPYSIHFGFGVLASWIYLRFYQKHSNGNRGDMAEDFTFSSFFPSPLDIFVAIISNTIFSLLIRVGVCKKPQRKYDVSSPTTITVTLPGTDPADAERRRQLAIKALNERLSKTGDEASWPGLEDDEQEGAEPELVVAGANEPLTTSEAVAGGDSTPTTKDNDSTGSSP
ncbi:transmembrane protein 115-like [Watersipora subatra]|uniref:transmembrane protein 115-like n=1 Tax=Watersipora subatra TaxID=2589382 RepID=UPI00355B2F5F